MSYNQKLMTSGFVQNERIVQTSPITRIQMWTCVKSKQWSAAPTTGLHKVCFSCSSLTSVSFLTAFLGIWHSCPPYINMQLVQSQVRFTPCCASSHQNVCLLSCAVKSCCRKSRFFLWCKRATFSQWMMISVAWCQCWRDVRSRQTYSWSLLCRSSPAPSTSSSFWRP